MLLAVGSLGQRAGALARDGVAATLALAVWQAPAWAADDAPSAASPDETAVRTLADEALRQAAEPGAEGLGAWSRSVIGRALERAGEAASDTADTAGTGAIPAPLPAERHAARAAAGLSGRPHTAEVLVFLSLAVPPESWTRWAHQAARAGAPLVLRGIGPEGFRATVKDIGRRLGGHDAGVAIDPRLFRLLGIERVPAVAVVPGGAPPCESRGCADDAPPPFDRVTGNIGLDAALEAIASEGEAGRSAARRHLERLNAEE